jgi:hypothetical protein
MCSQREATVKGFRISKETKHWKKRQEWSIYHQPPSETRARVFAPMRVGGMCAGCCVCLCPCAYICVRMCMCVHVGVTVSSITSGALDVAAILDVFFVGPFLPFVFLPAFSRGEEGGCAAYIRRFENQ